MCAVARGNLAVVGRPAHVKDGVGPAERAHELAGLDRPDAQLAVARAACEVVAAVAEAYPVHVVPVAAQARQDADVTGGEGKKKKGKRMGWQTCALRGCLWRGRSRGSRA